MSQRPQILHYVGIGIAVFIGVFAAGVAWFILTTHLAAEALEETARELVADSKEQRARQQAKQKAEQEARRRALELRRMNSQTGRNLGRRCREFTAFLRDNPAGGYAREQREEACRRFELFVETGQIYDKLPKRAQVRSVSSTPVSIAPTTPYEQALARIETSTGQVLRARCQELIAAYLESPSDGARAEREAACQRFERYLDTGQIAP